MAKKYFGILTKSLVLFVAALTLFALAGCNLFVGSSIKFRISASEITLTEGESVKLNTNSQSEVAWVSLDDDIAEIDEFGVVTGVSAGKTAVVAVSGGLQAECAVNVTENLNPPEKELTLIWHDEFDGDSLDMNNWSYQLGTHDVYGESIGTSNWGNNELQSYQEENIKLENGSLVITAQKEEEKVNGKSFTSGRITSRGKFTTLYGYVEARIKLPAVSGMWPAFWMLPQPSSTDKTGNVYGGWARNGELDIMEARGRIPTEVDTTLHFGGNYPQNTYKSKKAYLSTPITEWHTYAVDWRKEYIAWIVDGVETFRLTYDQWWTAAVPAEENPYAPFDQPFYILLNLAVGGTYDPAGTDDIKANNDFTSASMYVDYVRVYTHNN